MDYPSKVLSKAVEEIAGLPGIGKKSALRLALHLLRQPASQGISLGTSIQNLVTDIKYCKECHNFSDSDICDICSDEKRNDELLCVVEDVRDVMAIENTGKYKGKYLVLGGKISPMEGIGPSQLRIGSVEKEAESTPCRLATSSLINQLQQCRMSFLSNILILLRTEKALSDRKSFGGFLSFPIIPARKFTSNPTNTWTILS